MLDPSGNIYVAGTTNSFCCGAFLLKYNSTGSLLWQKVLSGNNNSFVYTSSSANALALDSKGNIYVTGYTSYNYANGHEVLIVKIDSNGNLLWQKTWVGAANDYGQAITTDSSGGVYVTGATYSFTGSNNENVFVLKLRSNGSLVWQETWGANLYNYGTGIALDSSGNIFVSCQTSNSQYYNNNGALLKLDSAGRLLWQEQLNVANAYNLNTAASAVTVDSTGSAYLTGNANYAISSAYSNTYYTGIPIVKFNPDGTIMWQTMWLREGPYYYNQPSQTGYSLALDPTGNIFIAGQANHYPNENNPNGFLLLEFSSSGDLKWEAATAASDSDAGRSIAIDTSGDPIAVGSIYETPPHSLTALSYPSLSGNFTIQTLGGQLTPTNATLPPLNALISTPPGSQTYSGQGDAYILKLQPPQPSPPSPPLALVAQAGQSSISLSWAPPQYTGGPSITGYNIYKGSSTGSEKLIANISTTHAYVDSNVKSGGTYYYYVKAVNALGESDASNENYATIGTTTGLTIPINPAILGGASVLVLAVVGFLLYERRRRSFHFKR